MLFVSAGARCAAARRRPALVELRRFDADISAMALSPQGRLAVALGGQRVLVLDGPTAPSSRVWTPPAASALHAVNALAFDGEDRLLVSDGSADIAPEHWCHDLMEHGRSGRVLRWTSTTAPARELLAAELALCLRRAAAAGGAVLVSESWRHRVVRVDGARRGRARW